MSNEMATKRLRQSKLGAFTSLCCWKFQPHTRVGMVKKFTSKKKFETFAGLLVKLLPAKMVKMVKNI